jgi:hypothetical protein
MKIGGHMPPKPSAINLMIIMYKNTTNNQEWGRWKPLNQGLGGFFKKSCLLFLQQ